MWMVCGPLRGKIIPHRTMDLAICLGHKPAHAAFAEGRFTQGVTVLNLSISVRGCNGDD